MKHDPEVKIFYSDRHFYNSEEKANTRVAVNFVDESRYCTSINHLDTPLQRYNKRKHCLGESILLLLAKTTECTFLYILDRFQGV